jgi:hypothetical protein
MSTKRQIWAPGSVVEIPLGDGSSAFAQMLDSPEYAFFDLRSQRAVDPAEVVRHTVLFRLWVMRYAHSKGRWLKIGKAEVPDDLTTPVYRYRQDMINPSRIELTYHGEDGPRVSIDDCEGLECAAVWDPDHVEDRLRDHFADRPNKWAQSLRPKSLRPQKTDIPEL